MVCGPRPGKYVGGPRPGQPQERAHALETKRHIRAGSKSHAAKGASKALSPLAATTAFLILGDHCINRQSLSLNARRTTSTSGGEPRRKLRNVCTRVSAKAAPRTTSLEQSRGSNRNKLLRPERQGQAFTPPRMGRTALNTRGQTAKCLMSSPPGDPQPKGQAPTATRFRNLREVGRALHHNLSKDHATVAGSFIFAHWRSRSSANHTEG